MLEFELPTSASAVKGKIAPPPAPSPAPAPVVAPEPPPTAQTLADSEELTFGDMPLKEALQESPAVGNIIADLIGQLAEMVPSFGLNHLHAIDSDTPEDAEVSLEIQRAHALISTLRKAGRWCQENGQSEIALKAYLTILKFDSDDAKILLAVADIYTSLGSLRVAENYYLEALNNVHDDDEDFQEEVDDKLSELYVKIGNAGADLDPEKAIQSFSDALEVNPNNGVALCGLGNIALANNDLENAEAAFINALDTNSGPAFLGLAKVKIARGDFDGAEVYFYKALKRKDVYFEAVVALADFNLYHRKSLLRAKPYIERALALQPDDKKVLALKKEHDLLTAGFIEMVFSGSINEKRRAVARDVLYSLQMAAHGHDESRENNYFEKVCADNQKRLAKYKSADWLKQN